MFERLAGKLLSRLLSKYFRSSSSSSSSSDETIKGSKPSSSSSTAPSTSSTAATSSSGAVNTQLSVWSGYVTLENLELRQELVNDWLEREGLGIELVQCTLRRVELTVPWSKLTTTTTTSTASSSSSLDGSDPAVVVVVLDGVHVLLRTKLQWNDAAMREETIRKRRQSLSEVVEEAKGRPAASASDSSTFVAFLKRRMSQWHGFAKQLQLHVRDVHIRWEDVESDPLNPFACGITMESMHIQHDDNYHETATITAPQLAPAEVGNLEIIRKVAQLNHLAIYWNALDFVNAAAGVLTEFSVLHQSLTSTTNLQKILDRSIARRASMSSTLFTSTTLFPKHSYLLLPVDATMHGVFSSPCQRDSSTPSTLLASFSSILEIDLVSVQLRDFQYSGILTCLAAFREHARIKRYRKYYRPTVSVSEDPRAWWYYAWQVIRYELKSHMRWSWKRFYQRFAQRQRYCDLYERYLRSTTSITSTTNNTPGSSARPSRQNSRASELDRMGETAISGISSEPTAAPSTVTSMTTTSTTTPDDGAGPSNIYLEQSASFAMPASYTSTSNVVRASVAETVLPSTLLSMSMEERQELQQMEDGLRGELSLDDILLYRALVTSRLHPRKSNGTDATISKQRYYSWWRGAIQNEVIDDRAAIEELDRLLAYVEQTSDNQQNGKVQNPTGKNQVVLSLDLRLGQGCVAFFSPLASTADLEPRRRLQERFFEFIVVSLEMQVLLMGDYSNFRFHAALANLLASEIRSNRRHYAVIGRSYTKSSSLIEIEDTIKGDGVLFDVTVETNSEGRDDCDIVLDGQVELLHIFLAPDCEWIERIIKLANCVPSAPKMESFWEDITMAMVNSWGRGLVHLRKKAAAVIFNHKRVDLNISVRCPIIHVGGGNEDESLVVDIGTAHLTTEKLGGCAVMTTKKRKAAVEPDNQTTASPNASPRRKLFRKMSSLESPMPDRFDLRSSTMSVDGFTPFMSKSTCHTNCAESFQFVSEDFADVEYENPVDTQEGQDLQSCFYDTYQLHVRGDSGAVFWVDRVDNEFLIDSIDLRVFIKKSVLPTDHTLCRLKCKCLVDSLSIGVSLTDILRLTRVLKVWRDIFGKHESSPFTTETKERRNPFRLSKMPSYNEADDASDSSSQLDENEFFDPLESEVESAGLDEPVLIDSNVMVDTGGKATFRSRRRPRLPSVSDVSTSSDQSTSQKHQGRRGVIYLSAENLAKLDERAVEEECSSRGTDPSMADTFHSALSRTRQVELATELERSIFEVEANISLLNDRLSEASKMRVSSSSEAKERRLLRQSVLLELERSATELRALNSAREDLTSDMISSQDYLERQKAGLDAGDMAGGEIQFVPPIAIIASVGRAKALVLDRSRRRAAVADGLLHTLTLDLNRELFAGSIAVGSVAIELRGFGDSIVSEDRTHSVVVSIIQTTIGVVYRAKNVKVYWAIDHMSVKSLESPEQSTCHLFLGGVFSPLSQLLLPSQYPHHLSSATMDERLCRVSIDIQHGKQGLRKKSTRVRVEIGDLELQPQAAVLSYLASSFRALHKEIGTMWDEVNVSSRQVGAAEKLERGLVPFSRLDQSLFDMNVKFTSLRLRLTQDERTVGSVALTEVVVRLLHDASDKAYRARGHLEVRVGNVQLLDIDPSSTFTCRELFGRQECHESLVRVLTRWQLFPISEQGGLAVDRAFIRGSADTEDEGGVAWNLHCGSKVQSIGVWASSSAIFRQCSAIQKLLDAVSTSAGSHEVVTCDDESPEHRTIPVRWRWDLLVRKLSIDLPSILQPGLSVSDETRAFCVLVSLSACLQPATSFPPCMALSVAATGLSIFQSTDHWPLLDDAAALFVAKFAKAGCARQAFEQSSIRLPSDSAWNFIPAVMHRYRWDDYFSSQNDVIDLPTSLTIAFGAFRVNVTPQICTNLVNTASLLLRPFGSVNPRTTRTTLLATPLSTKIGRSTSDSQEKNKNYGGVFFHLKAYLESLELRVSRQVDRKPAKVYLLAEAKSAELSMMNRGGEIDSIVSLDSFAVYDLSLSPGVRILGQQEPLGEINKMHSAPEGGQLRFVLARWNTSLSSNKSTTLSVDFGHIHFLLLPSFFQSVVALSGQLGGQAGIVPSPEVDVDKRQKLLCTSYRVDITGRIGSFECDVPSKDLESHIQENGNDSLSVVVVRWSSDAKAEVWTSYPKQKNEDPVDLASQEICSSGLEALRTEPSSQDAALLFGSQMNSVITNLNLHIGINRFMIARTTIRKQMDKERKIGNLNVAPYVFLSSFPSTGEQRITNPVDCKLTYRGVLIAKNVDSERTEMALSQVAIIETRLIDILVYINQSAGGINDALRVTILPIISMLSNNETNKDNAASRGTLYLDEIVRNGTFVWSIRADGFQVTCVPGGATRLTESPIIKCSLLKLEAGGGVVAVPRELQRIPCPGKSITERQQRELESPLPVQTPYVDSDSESSFAVLHVATGAWMNAELSASYHNRRLVAWEPFVESWVFSARVGGDLTQLLSLNPVECLDSVSWDLAQTHRNTNERMRGLGRLLRSTFKHDATAQENLRQDEPFTILSHGDLCFHMLATDNPTDISPAVYFSPIAAKRRPPSQDDAPVQPGSRPQEWLQQFGYPDTTSTCLHPSLVVSISDSMTLNVNLTGALLETLAAYLSSGGDGERRPAAPHRIRNDSGMTIRFQEVLDPMRLRIGEKSSKKILVNGNEIPLSLKRSQSQSCDPHRGYISLELGSFEDTAGRLNHDEFNRPEGSLSTTFYFKVASKIAVDTVGVHKYPISRNFTRRAGYIDKERDSRRLLGYIIVRVALQGGVKLVSIESPFVLKNDSDVDIICELRSHEGLSLLWRCCIPKLPCPFHGSTSRRGLVPVPVDLVSSIHDKSHRLSIVALPRTSSRSDDTIWESFARHRGCRIAPPPPYSLTSVSRRLIKLDRIRLNVGFQEAGEKEKASLVHLDVCSMRIGSLPIASTRSSAKGSVTATTEVPEQRMLRFQSPMVVRSHLPTTTQIQVRASTRTRSPDIDNLGVDFLDWEVLGCVECGQAVSWTGSSPDDAVEIRCRLLDDDGHASELFPSWSTVAVIPPTKDTSKGALRPGNSKQDKVFMMKLSDRFGQELSVSLTVDPNKYLSNNDFEDVKLFAGSLPLSARSISIYVPFWIVDSTNQSLEFFAGSSVAGQLTNHSFEAEAVSSLNKHDDYCAGLAELFCGDSDLAMARPPFHILMIGDGKASKLTMRRRMARGITGEEIISPFSNPIFLRLDENGFQDISVPSATQVVNGQIRTFEPYALCSRVFPAPERFGGVFGTKILHIVNRFEVVNEMGRDIEILSERMNGVSMSFRAERSLRPFHFDDSGPICFRPIELGWFWSGKIEITRKRKEIMVRLRHKLRNEIIIASVEFYTPKNPPVTYIVFRNASHPPFRIENHSMYPLSIRQSRAEWSLSYGPASAIEVLLPYQNLDFAWDQPDGKNKLVIEVTNLEKYLEDTNVEYRQFLGAFDVERIAPGTKLRVLHESFAGHVVADGPTRIIRLTDSTAPVIPGFQRNITDKSPRATSNIVMRFEVKLVHGIGVSLVDWTPQELVYLHCDDLLLERRLDEKLEQVNFSIACITLDNQLWLTPYPVMLYMGNKLPSSGRRRLNRNNGKAVTVAWCRRRNTNNTAGNLTHLERVEVATEPLVLNVDSQLVDLIASMFHRVSGAEVRADTTENLPSRNSDLRKVLGISVLAKNKFSKNLIPQQHPSNADFATLVCTRDLMTAVFASKQMIRGGGSEPTRKNCSISKVEWIDSILQPRPKIYLERLRIATAKAEISWSGPLPGALMSFPQFMRPALTFEGLPLLIRPFSCSHNYGTLEDHVEALKSHYLSVWRIFDLLVGLASKPTFIVRACIYTFRERLAVTFDALAKALSNLNSALTNSPRHNGLIGMLPEVTRSTDQASTRNGLTVVKSSFTLGSTLLSASAKVASSCSLLLHYGPMARIANRVHRGVVRSRNPRLFATTDGNDLLVAYVEGENAGRALLSRVRTGAHSVEGYIYHCECSLQKKKPLESICMITSQRILLLNGVRDNKFCDVKWEAMFDNLVHIEILNFEKVEEWDVVKFWYLSGTESVAGNRNDRINTFAQAVVGEGLAMLSCTDIFVPRSTGLTLRDKVNTIQNSLVNTNFVTNLSTDSK